MKAPRMWNLAAAILVPLALAAAPAAAGFTAEEAAYKRAQLQRLHPYDAMAGREEREDWLRLIGLAAKYHDYEIVAHILSLSAETEPATRPQYAFDLFTLYAMDSEFFIDSASIYFEGDCAPLLHLWIDSSGDITADLLRAYVPSDSDNVLLGDFIAMAEAREEALRGAQ